ncbi:SUKH-4 family immunity protein [Streptomyces sp. NPDC055287]
MGADDVARRLLRAWGVTDEAETLTDGVRRLTRDGVALLANVHWAGEFVTSGEASRITNDVVAHFGRSDRSAIRFVIEREADKPWVFLPTRNELVLQPSLDLQAADTDLAPLLEAHPALRALAAAELRDVPLAVWQELCGILEIGVSQKELTGLPERLPALLDVSLGADGDVRVSFRAEAVRHRIRDLSPVDHGTVVTALLRSRSERATGPWRTAGPVGTYATKVLGLHAVHAGMLDDVLSDGHALANLDATGLLQSLAVRWPGGVPQGSLATDAHYLERLGLAPAPHEQWVAWLQHCALNRGEVSLADAIVETAGAQLPWHTIWSNCRPFGMFGRFRQVDGQEPGHPLHTDFSAEEISAQTADSHTWQIPDASLPIRHIFDASRDDFSFFRSKRLPDGHWLVVGASGPFVVIVNAAADKQDHLSRMPVPYIGSITQAGVWECPPAAWDDDEPTGRWLEATFGPGTCRRLHEKDVPTALVDTSSRRFLADIGLPYLSGHLPFMMTVDVSETGLVSTPWSGGMEPPEVSGPFYYLGDWAGGHVLLDGGTGAVVQDGSTGYDDVILATGLRQFLIVLRLCHEFLISDFATNFEREDARRSLQEWADRIDPATEGILIWEQALSSDLDAWVDM